MFLVFLVFKVSRDDARERERERQQTGRAREIKKGKKLGPEHVSETLFARPVERRKKGSTDAIEATSHPRPFKEKKKRNLILTSINSSLTNSSSSTPVATCVASAAARLRTAASGLPAGATPIAEGSVVVVVEGGLLAKAGPELIIDAGAGGGVSQAAPPPPPLPPARRRSMYCSPRQAAMARTPQLWTTTIRAKVKKKKKKERKKKFVIDSAPCKGLGAPLSLSLPVEREPLEVLSQSARREEGGRGRDGRVPRKKEVRARGGRERPKLRGETDAQKKKTVVKTGGKKSSPLGRIFFSLFRRCRLHSLSLGGRQKKKKKKKKKRKSDKSAPSLFRHARSLFFSFQKPAPCFETRTIRTSSPGRRRGGCTRFVLFLLFAFRKREKQIAIESIELFFSLSHLVPLSRPQKLAPFTQQVEYAMEAVKQGSAAVGLKVRERKKKKRR